MTFKTRQFSATIKSPIIPCLIAILVYSCLVALPCSAVFAPENSSLIVGVPREFPPQYRLDNEGNPTGFTIETMDHIAAKPGYKIQYKIYDNWSSTFSALLSGKVHLIPNLGISEKRKDYEPQKSDLIVLDLMLPGMSGFEIIQQLKKNTVYDIPILSAKDLSPAEKTELYHSVELVLTKGKFDYRVMLDSIHHVLDKTNQHRKEKLESL